MTRLSAIRATAGAVLLALIAAGAAGCVESAVTRAEPARAPQPLGWELTPAQQRLMMQPVSPRAAAGRPATRADLEELRSSLSPGEWGALLTVVNRHARATGADTLPHCTPLCEAAAAEKDPDAP